MTSTMTPAIRAALTAADVPSWVARLRLCLAANTPALLVGPPGVGKTDLVRASHDALFPDLPLVTIIVSQTDPSELNGLPVVMPDGTVAKASWSWVDALCASGGGTVFLDELTTAPPASQAAAMRLVLERVVGDTALPDTVRFVAAANPTDCAAGGWELAAPLANRLAHIEVGRYGTTAECAALSADLTPGWCGWALARYTATDAEREASALVAGFVSSNPSVLFAFPSEESQRSGAWASPRSWATYCRVLATAIDAGARDAGLDLAAAFVGRGEAAAFRSFARTSGLPRALDLLEGRATYQWDRARADLARAVLLGAATTAVHHDVDDRGRAALIEAAWSLVNGACGASLKEATIGAAKVLRQWRKGSKAPAAMGAEEANAVRALGKALSDVLAATR